MAIESKEELETWQYLRASYYPRFVEGVTGIPWDILTPLSFHLNNLCESPILLGIK